MSSGLHLYRRLLRECTYLPDPVARQWFSQYINRRFRRLQIDRPGSKWERLTPKRQRQAYSEARKGTQILRRANAGYSKPLAKVLCYTYARIGPRRREIVSQLIRPDVPSDQDALLKLRNQTAPDRDPRFSSKILALMSSQKNRQFVDNRLGTLRRLTPDIPEKNIWERPMPQCRVRNQLKKFKAKTYSRLLAPLPEEEWYRLYDLATGQIKWSGAIPRRRKAGADAGLVEETTLASALLEQGKPRTRSRRQDTPHIVTARFMQRQWSKILSQTPRLVFDEVRSCWTVKWYDPDGLEMHTAESTQQTIALSASLNVTPITDAKIFEGVDRDGRLIEHG